MRFAFGLDNRPIGMTIRLNQGASSEIVLENQFVKK